MPMRYDRFHLVLMATHACNLRCSYCYTGRKFCRPMPLEIGFAAIRRAARSLQAGGTLELGFFGGEPLLEAESIARWIDFAEEITAAAGIGLRLGMTTNGTIHSDAAWTLMMRPDLELCVSHDGLPEVHDRHRRRGDRPSADQVAETFVRLLSAGREVRAVMVVRPDSAARLREGIGWLWERGVRRFDPSLDLWTTWDRAGLESLEAGLNGAAAFWQQHLPEIGVSWFDEKAAHLLGLPIEASARCGFGEGEIAVAPSGNLYPCERLIGEDRLDHPLRLAGNAVAGDDFCRSSMPRRSASECAGCAARQQCSTSCRCSNFVRTGDIHQPDALLCFLDRVCVRETRRVLNNLARFENNLNPTQA
jgi:uncharacterized protein